MKLIKTICGEWRVVPNGVNSPVRMDGFRGLEVVTEDGAKLSVFEQWGRIRVMEYESSRLNPDGVLAQPEGGK